MKVLTLLVIVFCIACSSSKKNKYTDNATVTNPADTLIPKCMEDKIAQFSAEEKQNPPRSIYSYSYEGKTVYYVTAPCCDFFSDLYDSSCILIGHPDGGFTGKGDGKMPGFAEKRTNERLIWKDNRK